MRNLFSSRKMMFVLGLVSGAFLMLLFTFALPGKRTYIGHERGMEMPRMEAFEEEERIEYIAKETKRDIEEELIEEEPKELGPGEEFPMLEPAPDLETRRVGEKKGEERISREETAKAEPREYPMISHDHIPVKWEYKMKE